MRICCRSRHAGPAPRLAYSVPVRTLLRHSLPQHDINKFFYYYNIGDPEHTETNTRSHKHAHAHTLTHTRTCITHTARAPKSEAVSPVLDSQY